VSDETRARDVAREVRASARTGVETALAGSARVFEFAVGSRPLVDVLYVPGEHHDRLMAFVAGLMNSEAVSGDWRPTFDPEAN
jgi:hypothetical protein